MKLSSMGLVLTAFLIACSPKPHAPSKVEAAELLRSKTIALVHAAHDDNPVRAYCTGVWVSPKTILTANHCVADEKEILYVIDRDVIPPGVNYVKDVIKPRPATVTAVDDAHDLALVTAGFPVPEHGVGVLTETPPAPGQFVQQIGQPFGLWWSYSSGDVSAIRYLDTGKGPLFWIQATAPSSPGNSGGGLWNENLELVGLLDQFLTRGQNLNLYVHPKYIGEFLSKHPDR